MTSPPSTAAFNHSVILELNVGSYSQRAAAVRQKQRTTSDNKRDNKEKLITAPPI